MKDDVLFAAAAGILVGMIGFSLVIDALPVPGLFRRLETGAYEKGWGDRDREAKYQAKWESVNREIKHNLKLYDGKGCSITDKEIFTAGLQAGVSVDVVSYRANMGCPPSALGQAIREYGVRRVP